MVRDERPGSSVLGGYQRAIDEAWLPIGRGGVRRRVSTVQEKRPVPCGLDLLTSYDR
jgi:hypothetical protein